MDEQQATHDGRSEAQPLESITTPSTCGAEPPRAESAGANDDLSATYHSTHCSNRSPSSRQLPHFMQPLNRRTQEPSPAPVEEISFAPTTTKYRFPTPEELSAREAHKRQVVSSEESHCWSALQLKFTSEAQEVARTVSLRGEYLQSKYFQRLALAGKERRARIEKWEVEKQRADESTFVPRVSRVASQRPRRTVDEFIKSNEAWKESLEKKRRATSATVIREEDATFAPKILSTSKKIVAKLETQEKHCHIVEGWTRRLEEQKRKVKELEDKYAPSFRPNADRASSLPSPVSSKAVIARLYSEACVHKKFHEERLEEERRKNSPPTIKRREDEITRHIQSMETRTTTSQQRLDTKRSQSILEETALEHNNHTPIVNNRSHALAQHFREKKMAEMAKDDEGKSRAAHSPKAPTTVYDLLYAAHRAVSGDRDASPKEGQRPRSGAVDSSRSRSRAFNEPEGIFVRTAPERSAEFMMRSQKTVLARQHRVEELQGRKEAAEARNCTFAPEISKTTIRLAESRRSSVGGLYRDPLLGCRSHSYGEPERSRSGEDGSHRYPFARTDHESPMPRRAASESSDTIQERLDDIDGLLRQWNQLDERAARM